MRALSGVRLASSAVSETAITTGYAVTSCVIGAALLCGAWVIMARQQPLLKAAQPRVLLVVLLGILISLSAPFFFSRDHRASFEFLHACGDLQHEAHKGHKGLEDHEGGFECTDINGGHVHFPRLDVMCNAQVSPNPNPNPNPNPIPNPNPNANANPNTNPNANPNPNPNPNQVWAWCTGFLVSFSAMYYKLYRITSLVIRRGDDLTAQGVVRQRLVKAAPIVLLLVQSLVLLAMSLVAPLRWRITGAKEFIVPLEKEGSEEYKVQATTGRCAIDDANLAFLLPLFLLRCCFLLFGSVLCYQARNLHVKYAEVKYIGFTLWSQLQILVITVLLAFLSPQPTPMFFLKLCFTLFTEGGTLVFLFAPKMLMLVRGKGLERAKRVLKRTAVAAALGERRPSDSLDSSPCSSRAGSRRPSRVPQTEQTVSRSLNRNSSSQSSGGLSSFREANAANIPPAITPTESSDDSLDELAAASDGGGGVVCGSGGGGSDDDGGSGDGSRVDDSDARGVGLGEVTLAGEVVFDLDSDSQDEPPQHA